MHKTSRTVYYESGREAGADQDFYGSAAACVRALTWVLTGKPVMLDPDGSQAHPARAAGLMPPLLVFTESVRMRGT